MAEFMLFVTGIGQRIHSLGDGKPKNEKTQRYSQIPFDEATVSLVSDANVHFSNNLIGQEEYTKYILRELPQK